ncbi:hypothetical protein G9A89_013714 [Geosiphon pyriformis]|nr:hypothetical protein G9A89_013714 [Geosiphon pyriformis]
MKGSHDALSSDIRRLIKWFPDHKSAVLKLKAFEKKLPKTNIEEETSKRKITVEKKSAKKPRIEATEADESSLDEQEESQASGSDDLLNRPYEKVLEQIKAVQMDDTAAFINPLYWGVIDLRQAKISPSPFLLRGKELLPQQEYERLCSLMGNIVEEESHLNDSSAGFLEAIEISGNKSIGDLGMRFRANGTAGIGNLIREGNQKAKALLRNFNEFDEDTQYIAECFSAIARWLKDFNGDTHSERNVDGFALLQLAKVPGARFDYGENHSQADKEEKESRSNLARIGKPCDYLFRSGHQEIGCGENSGPKCKDSMDKANTDFIDVVKVARSQHIAFLTECTETSGLDPLSTIVQDACELIVIPFFQLIGYRIRFYILLQVSGELYAIWQWGSELLPTHDDHVKKLLSVCKLFFLYRNLLARVQRLGTAAIDKAKGRLQWNSVVLERKAKIQISGLIEKERCE